jgi:formylglycine-generating enzyme required for sulfatase activity
MLKRKKIPMLIQVIRNEVEMSRIIRIGSLKPKSWIRLVGLGILAILFFSISAMPDQTAGRKKTVSLEGTDIILVYIPAGEFMMGSPQNELGRQPSEGPQRRVKIARGFWMGETEVSLGQWKAVTGQDVAGFFRETPEHPVKWMTWDEIQEFITSLNKKIGEKFRLPSEAEWEYACRAGTVTPFSAGDSLGSDQANFDGQYPYGSAPKGVAREGTVPVKSFPPNPWGLYDMHGNVYEWCQDTYRPDAYAHPELYDTSASGGPVYLGRGPQRVFRGGGWLGGGAACRSAGRFGERGDYAFNFLGFRLVLDE